MIHEAARPRALLGGTAAEGRCCHRLPYRFLYLHYLRGPMTRTIELSRVLHVRLPLNEYEAFTAATIRLREPRSRLLRRAVRDIIGRPANLLDHELVELVGAVYQLKAVGRNLYQLIRAVHVGQVSVADTALLDSVRASVTDLDARIAALVSASRLRWVRR